MWRICVWLGRVCAQVSGGTGVRRLGRDFGRKKSHIGTTTATS